ncbi:MAG: selenite/tellurite reduction operon porin ExtI [Desulfurivibrionaceae bacterium]
MKIPKIAKYCVPMLAFAMLAGPLQNGAQAGPTIEFGDADQGLLKIDYKTQFQLSSRDTGSGPDDEDTTNTMGFRRNRLAFIGAWGDMYGIYVQTDFFENSALGTLGENSPSFAPTDDFFTLIDAQVRIKFNDMARLRLGKFKANHTRENLEDCYAPLSLDRSRFLQEPYVISRDIGISLWGNLISDKVQYKLDILEGKPANTDALESNFRYSGRIHVSLLDPESGYGYKGTYLGKKKVLTIGAGFQHEADLVYLNNDDPQAGTEDYNAYTVDLFTELPMGGAGTVTFSAAYADFDFGDRPSNFTHDPDASGQTGERDGYYVKAGYMLPSLPLQFFGRMENWTFAELNGVEDHELDWLGVGINYFIDGQANKLTLEYSDVGFDERDTANEDFSTIVAQYQFIF